MKGHVYKRTGKRFDSWAYVVDAPRGVDGKRRQRTRSGFRTRKEAEAALARVLHELETGLYVEPSKQAFGAFLDAWLSSIQTTVRASTLASYRQQVENHVKPHLGSQPVQALTAAKLNAFYADLLATGRKRGKGGLSKNTVRYVHVILHRALDDAVRWNMVPRNVADLATAPKQERSARPKATWTPDEARAFFDAVGDHSLAPLFVLAATTGMRRGELVGLRWRSVDLEAGRLSVVESAGHVDKSLVVGAPKSKRSTRTVALDPGTVAVLRAHRKAQAEHRMATRPTYQDNDLVFARADGDYLHPDWVSKTFVRFVKLAKVRPISLHGLRHTFATLALAANIHPKIVADRLGHSSISVTLDTYSHAVPEMQEEAAGKVAGMLFG